MFESRGALTQEGSIEFAALVDVEKVEPPQVSRFEVSLRELGWQGPVRARDLWTREDLGEFQGSFSQEILPHSAGLYRLTPVVKPSDAE